MRQPLAQSLKSATYALRNEPSQTALEALGSIGQSIAMGSDEEFRSSLNAIHDLIDLARTRGYACQSIPAIQSSLRVARTNRLLAQSDVDFLHFYLGLAHGECHDYAAAITIFEELLKQPQIDKDLRRLTVFKLGSSYAAGGDSNRAIPLLRTALSAASERRPQNDELASIEVTLARALLDVGDFVEAATLASHAIPFLDNRGDPVEAAFARDVHGKALEMAGEYKRAREQFEQALALLRNHVGEEHHIYAKALTNLASVYFSQGEYREAEGLLDRAFQITCKTLGTDHPQTIPILINLLLVRAETADDDGVERLLHSLQEKLSRVPSHPAALGIVWHRLGVVAQKRKRFEEANTYLQKAADSLPYSPFQEAIQNQMAGLAILRNDLDLAQSILEGVLNTHRLRHTDQTNEYAATMLGLAEVALARLHWPEAIDQAEHAARVIAQNSGDAHPDRARCFEIMCCGHLGQHHLERAVDCLRELANVQGHQLLDVVSVLSTRRQDQMLRRFHRLLTLAAGISLKAIGHRYCLEFAFEILIQRKALSAEMASARLSTLNRYTDDAQSEADKLIALYRDLATGLLQPEGKSIVGLKAFTDALLEKRDAIERSITPPLLLQLGTARDLDIGSLIRSLPSGSAYIDFVYTQRIDPQKCEPVGDGDTYCVYWATSSGHFGMTALAPFEVITDVVWKFRDSLLQPEQSVYQLNAEQAYQTLLSPLPSEVRDAKRLYVSLEGILNIIPFGALSSGDALPLLATTTIIYVDSAREIIVAGASGNPYRDSAANPPVIVGDPDFDAEPTNEGRPSGLSDLPGFERAVQALDYFKSSSGAQAELAAIRKLLPNAIFWTGAQASKRNMMHNLARPILLHVVTHAVGNLQAKGFDNAMSGSYLVLAGFNGLRSGISDGTLSGLEASLLDLRGCELVVLAGCETGLGRAEVGAGVQGLRRGFQVAGARSQIVSLWKIDGEATAPLMAEFYRGLTRGLEIEEALRMAQYEMARSGAAPEAWAGFQLFGPGGRLTGLARFH